MLFLTYKIVVLFFAVNDNFTNISDGEDVSYSAVSNTYYSVSNIIARKFGKLLVLYCSLSCSTTSDSWITIANLSGITNTSTAYRGLLEHYGPDSDYSTPTPVVIRLSASGALEAIYGKAGAYRYVGTIVIPL